MFHILHKIKNLKRIHVSGLMPPDTWVHVLVNSAWYFDTKNDNSIRIPILDFQRQRGRFGQFRSLSTWVGLYYVECNSNTVWNFLNIEWVVRLNIDTRTLSYYKRHIHARVFQNNIFHEAVLDSTLHLVLDGVWRFGDQVYQMNRYDVPSLWIRILFVLHQKLSLSSFCYKIEHVLGLYSIL